MNEHWDPALGPRVEWRRRRALETQRERRRKVRRLDYYPSEEARAVIDGLRGPGIRGTASAILNRIVLEWVETQRG